jgi:DNA-binding MarR family transcriptional regulator
MKMTPEQMLSMLRPTFNPGICTTRQLGVLALLFIEGRQTPFKLLRKNMGISSPALSRSVDTLEERNHVQRFQDDKDARKRFVALTPDGEAFMRLLGVGTLT